MNDYGILTLVPTLVVVVLALWSHRTIESLLAGSIVGLFILDPSNPLQLLADKSLAVMMNETVAWIILVCFFMGSLIALFIRTGAISAFTAKYANTLCTDRCIDIADRLPAYTIRYLGVREICHPLPGSRSTDFIFFTGSVNKACNASL